MIRIIYSNSAVLRPFLNLDIYWKKMQSRHGLPFYFYRTKHCSNLSREPNGREASLQAWTRTQEIDLRGGRMPRASIPPIDTESAVQETTDLKDWVSRSGQTPFTTTPPASLAAAIQKELSSKHARSWQFTGQMQYTVRACINTILTGKAQPPQSWIGGLTC